MRTLGQNLKDLRTCANLSQKQFAIKLDTTQQRVSDWETDKVEPSLYSIRKILKVLEISFDDLMDGIE